MTSSYLIVDNDYMYNTHYVLIAYFNLGSD